MKTLGQRVKARRDKLGLSVSDLHREMIWRDPDGAPSQGWIRLIEASGNPPALDRLRLLAHALGWTLGELLGEP